MESSNTEPAEQKDVLNILMVEDNFNDAELLEMFLHSSSLKVKCSVVSTKQDYIAALEADGFDVILSDHNLPQFNSLEALKIRNEISIHVPFILVSGTIPEEYAVSILQAGANDYILKDRPQRLAVAIVEAIKRQKEIAEKILAEKELEKVNERLKLAGTATADALWDWNLETNQLFWGEGFKILFGHQPESNADITSWHNYIHPDDKARVLDHIKKFFEDVERTVWQDEYRYSKADGSYVTVLDKGLVIRDEKGKALRMVGAMQDISRLKQLEKKIIQQQLIQQQESTKVALQAQEQERNKIGRELHDNINQLLANAKMMIDTARRSPEIYEQCMTKGREAISIAIEEVRKLSHTLVQPPLQDGDMFVDSIHQLAEDISTSTNMKVEIDVSENINKLDDPDLRLTIYRILQEHLNNIIKYSKATTITIELSCSEKAIDLLIADNGIGFDAKQKRSGIGLRNIESRIELYSGTVQIISSPGNGCQLKVNVPFTSKIAGTRTA